jgi:hypothetical protein
MPFTTSEARRMTDAIGPTEVGDRCFLAYRKMLRAWRAAPKWTTAHNLYVEIFHTQKPTNMHPDDAVAEALAWQVFFQLHVMPYELQKRTLNGEVDY